MEKKAEKEKKLKIKEERERDMETKRGRIRKLAFIDRSMQYSKLSC